MTTDFVDEWDPTANNGKGEQVQRPCTADEQNEIYARRAAAKIPKFSPSVTRKAARLALLNARKFHLIQPAINAMPEPLRTRAQIEWDDSDTYERNDTMLIALGYAIGLTEDDMDALFIAAKALETP